jgi:predicted  nucleic acid-binding Zn-ribbon protein
MNQKYTQIVGYKDEYFGKCPYCGVKLGKEHSEGCVCRKRTVVIKATFEYAVEVPEFWDKSEIEFSRNDGSWCVDNALDELKRVAEHQGCLCHLAKFEYVREATEADEEDLM